MTTRWPKTFTSPNAFWQNLLYWIKLSKSSHLNMTFMYTAWPMGTDGNLFPLWCTAFIITKSQQSSGFCSCLSAFINASTLVQDISPFRENKFTSSPWLGQLSHWPLATQVQIQSQASLYGICGGQSGTLDRLLSMHFSLPLSGSFQHCPALTFHSSTINLIHI